MTGHEILFALWFFWPAGVATLMPVLAAYTPYIDKWDAPMDGGKSWRGKRLLGSHKTWRGFLAGWLCGSLWALILTLLSRHNAEIRSIYPAGISTASFLWAGVLVSLGSVVGDAAGSFFKRQVGVSSGQSWFPYDQLDFILGGMILSLIAVRLPWVEYLIIPVVWILIHLVFGVLGYVTHTKPSLI